MSELYNSLKELLSNKSKLDELGQKAKLRAENDFTWAAIGNKYLQLIKNLDNFKSLKVKDIKNSEPIIINKDDSINKMLKITQSHDFLISFVPVINKKELVGSVTFFNLIRSES